MDLVTRGPVSAATLLWRRGSGWVLTLVCKAAFDIVPGEAELWEEPPPPTDCDVPWEAPFGHSLRAATDLVPAKAKIDVFLTGHAYAPVGRTSRSLILRLVVGESLDKSIEVVTDRHFDRAGALVEGAPFARKPLVYEHAAGGPGTWNPAGMVLGQKDARGNTPLPSILPVGTRILSLETLDIAPTGFGPLPASWPLRVEKLGRRSPLDLPSQWNGQLVPDDIDRDYFNAAPPDQQIEMFREDDMIMLEHLHPAYSSVGFKLPALQPTITREVGGTITSISPRLDTLHIDTDSATCMLIWRGHFALRDPREAGRIVVALDTDVPTKGGPPASDQDRATSTEVLEVLESSPDATLSFAPRFASAVLPFPRAGTAPKTPPPSPLNQSASWEAVRLPSPISPQSDLRETIAPPPMAPPPPPARPPLETTALDELEAPPPPPGAMAQSGSWGLPAPPPLPGAHVQTGSWGKVTPPPPPPPPTPGSPSQTGSWGKVTPPSSALSQSGSWSAPQLPPDAPPAPPPAPPPPPSLSQSGSWGAPPPVPSQPRAPGLQRALTLAGIAPPPQAAIPVHEAAPRPPSSAPVVIPAPPPSASAATGSPWAAGSASGPMGETIGMQATSGALALAEPKYKPLTAADAAPDLEIEHAPVQLLWFDPDSVGRVRRVPRWKKLLDELERLPLERDLDEAGGPHEPWDIEDRRDMFEVLSRGGPSDSRGVDEAFAATKIKGGKVVPPTVLVEGELEIMLDELEALKAAATAAAPLITPTDESLRAAVEAADGFLARPWLSPAPAVCEGLLVRIRESFVREKKALAADYLDRQTERALLSGRHYQKRYVLGGTYLRAFVRLSGEKDGLLAYLPDDLAKKLPMFRRCAMRLIVDVYPQQDQYETRTLALKVLAVARAHIGAPLT